MLQPVRHRRVDTEAEAGTGFYMAGLLFKYFEPGHGSIVRCGGEVIWHKRHVALRRREEKGTLPYVYPRS